MLFGRQKRQRILGAAFELFATRGFENTTLPAIQKKSRIALATIYKYFPSKERLVNEVYRDLRNELEGDLSTVVDEEKNPRTQFHDLWAQMAAFDRKHPLAIPFLENRHHGAYLDQRSAQLEHVPEPIIKVIDRMCRDKSAKNVPRMVLATVVWGTFVELVKLHSQGMLSASKEMLKAAEDCTWDAIRAEH